MCGRRPWRRDGGILGNDRFIGGEDRDGGGRRLTFRSVLQRRSRTLGARFLPFFATEELYTESAIGRPLPIRHVYFDGFDVDDLVVGQIVGALRGIGGVSRQFRNAVFAFEKRERSSFPRFYFHLEKFDETHGASRDFISRDLLPRFESDRQSRRILRNVRTILLI